jgi:hypothetical protein
MRRSAILLTIALLALSCAHSTTVWRMRIRGASTEFTVAGVVPRGGYLDVLRESALRTFLPTLTAGV